MRYQALNSERNEIRLFSLNFNNGHPPELPPPLISLLKATYWQRLWIQQEFALARSLVLASVSTWMPFTDIAKVMSDVRVYSWHVLTRDAPALFWHIETRYEEAVESYTIYDAIGFYASKLCQDPRDKVYGLLGMVSRFSSGSLESPSMTEIWTETSGALEGWEGGTI